MDRPLRVLELFCGIGGCAAAIGDRANIVAAVDVNLHALRVYAHNFRHPVHACTIESIGSDRWRRWDADLWWLSPPCQPFTRRGLRKDLDDPRAASLVSVMERIEALRPRYMALENVPGFQGSRAHDRLRQILMRGGYRMRECILCPSDLGVPNQRRRFYLVAARGPLAPWSHPHGDSRRFSIRDVLDEQVPNELGVALQIVERYREAIHLVDPDDPDAVCRCFTSAYGRSHVRSGSYLIRPGGVRRFSPREILRLLCFPGSFEMPADMPCRQAWPLAGNSLSVAAAQTVLSAIPELACQTSCTGR